MVLAELSNHLPAGEYAPSHGIVDAPPQTAQITKPVSHALWHLGPVVRKHNFDLEDFPDHLGLNVFPGGVDGCCEFVPVFGDRGGRREARIRAGR